MNTELVKQEIENILSTVEKSGRNAEDYQISALKSLGILELMPDNFGYDDAQIVIEAAKMNMMISLLNAPEVEEQAETQYGSEYEIEIFGMTDEDMVEIITALSEAGISGDDRDGIGMYLRDDRGNSVFVDPSDVGEAVKIINSLGYGTDEDE